MSIALKFSCLEAGKTSSYLVRRYIFLNSDVQTISYTDKHIPEGSCTLIFNFKGVVTMSIHGFPAVKLPPYFLALPYPGYVYIKASMPSDTFAVACKTSVFSALFNISLNDCGTPSFRTIDDVIPVELYDKLQLALSPQQRIKIFEKFLISKGVKDYHPDNVDIAYEKIYSSNGLLHIQDLISELNLNSRSFRRKFYQRVGVSAKSLCRIVRTSQIINAIKESKNIDYQKLVYSGKYFDQPHFVNDFRKFIGESPGTFFHRDIRLVKLFSGF